MNSNQGLKKLHSKGGIDDHVSSVEWSEHALGEMNNWPESFSTALNIVLNNSQPAFLLWEDESYTFPNKKFITEYLPDTNQKKITGLIAQTAIPEFWKLIKNETESLLKSGKPFDKTVHLDRLEHTDKDHYSLISLNASPVHQDDGSVGGLIVICTDVMPNYVMANELKDRIKEQEILQNISHLRENFTSVENYLEKLAGLIPPAMQFPNIAEASIEFEDKVYQSENYNDCTSPVFQVEESASGNKLTINVGYTQETSQATKNSIFVRKEKKLVQTIAGQASLTIENFNARQILQDTERQSNELLDSVNDGFLGVDKNSKIIRFNHSAEKLLGKNRDNVNGKNILEVFPEVKSFGFLRAYSSATKDNEPETLTYYSSPLQKTFKITIHPFGNGVNVTFSDISETNRQQDQYNKLSGIIDEVHNGVVVSGADSRIKWVSKTFTELTGFSSDESVGKTIQQLLPGPETDLNTIQRISENIDQKKASTEQILYYTKEGEELWIEEKIAPVLAEDKSAKEFITVLKNITRQKHLEKLLGQVQNMAKIGGWDYEMDGKKWIRGVDRPEYLDGKFVRIFDNIRDIEQRKVLEGQFNQSRKLLEALVEQADAGIWVVDSNRNVILMNEESKKLFGIQAIDVIGKPILDLIHEDSAERIEKYLNKVADTDTHFTFEESAEINDDKRTYLTNIFSIQNVPGLKNAAGAIYTDITSLKKTKSKLGKTEQKLQDIIGHSTNLFYSHTPDHKLTYLSPQSVDFLGFSPEEATVKWTELITDHPLNQKAIEITNRAIETATPQPPFELQLRKSDGEIIWVEAHESPIVEDGETIAIAGSLTDITKRKQTEAKLKESLNEKETLLSEIHHRVKNNLAIVSGLMQLQAYNTDNEEVAKLLNVSVSRMRSIAGIHEQLYQSNSFSSIDLSESLKRLITEVINTMQIPTKIHQDLDLQSVSVNMEQALPCSLIFNEVVTNILKHAFVESEEGTISVQLSEINNRVNLVISDDGVGIPDDFDIEKSDSLGMELVITLSEQLGAEISYKPVRKGTRFEMSFKKS